MALSMAIAALFSGIAALIFLFFGKGEESIRLGYLLAAVLIVEGCAWLKSLLEGKIK